ncbi:MAG: transglutaminase domain-containing protein [Desulfobacterales bacterium]|nr:transglutaminase domain-containing protein [Desulfobacterales bacterium]
MNTPLPLMGAAILFWGFVTRQWVLSALLAAAIAGSRLTEIRWKFKEADFRRIALLCAAGAACLTLYRLATGWSAHAAWMLLKWAPPLMAPLFLAQLYSTAGRVDLQALNPFKIKSDIPPTREPRRIDISYTYATLCVLGAAAANIRTPIIFVGAALFTGMALWRFRRPRCSPGLWLLLLLLAAAVGYGGQMGLMRLHDVVVQRALNWMAGERGGHSGGYNNFDVIGDIGDEKISGRIVFRVQPGELKTPPPLFQEVVYDTFRSNLNMWSAPRTGFRPLHPELEKNRRILDEFSGVSIRGCAVAQQLHGGGETLRLPPGVVKIDGIENVTGERNGLGTVRVKGEGRVVYRPTYVPGAVVSPPPASRDLHIPSREAGLLEEIVKKLDLRKLPPEKIPGRVASYFSKNFTYTLESRAKKPGATLMEHFLLHTRAGHCEYFATAAALILRAAGMPSRYVRGYAADPNDEMEGWHQVRARHAHAWVLAYARDRWVILDATPASWLAAERDDASWWESLTDYWDWFVFRSWEWRDTWDTEKITARLPWLLLPALMLAGWRLWRRRDRKKKKIEKKKTPVTARPAPGMGSDLYSVERRLAAKGFHRYEWETFSAWLNRLEQTSGSPVFPPIPRELLLLHNRRRFATRGLTDDEKAYMKSMVSKWMERCPADEGEKIGLERRRSVATSGWKGNLNG